MCTVRHSQAYSQATKRLQQAVRLVETTKPLIRRSELKTHAKSLRAAQMSTQEWLQACQVTLRRTRECAEERANVARAHAYWKWCMFRHARCTTIA